METRVAGKGFTGFCTEFIIFGRNAAGNNGMGWKKKWESFRYAQEATAAPRARQIQFGFRPTATTQKRRRTTERQRHIPPFVPVYRVSISLRRSLYFHEFRGGKIERGGFAAPPFCHFSIFGFDLIPLFLPARLLPCKDVLFFGGGGILIGFSIGKPSDAPWLLVPTDLYHCPPFST